MGLQCFDWTITDGGRWSLYFDGKVGLLSDVLNLKSPPYTTQELNFTGSWLEMRFGLNIISRNNFNTALGIAPIDIWHITGNRGYTRTYVTSGIFFKFDYKCFKNVMLRWLFAPDFINLKSSGSNNEKVTIYNNVVEAIHRNGLFVGLAYISSYYGPVSPQKDMLEHSRRFELKFGIKLINW